jgi:hypothetical protein
MSETVALNYDLRQKQPKASTPLPVDVRRALLEKLSRSPVEAVAYELALSPGALRRAAQGVALCRSTAYLVAYGLGFKPAF